MEVREIKSNFFLKKNYSNLEAFWWNKNNIFENSGSACIEKYPFWIYFMNGRGHTNKQHIC